MWNKISGAVILSFMIVFVVSLLLGILVGATADNSAPVESRDSFLLTSTNYQAKYAREVCKQRNSLPHFIGSDESYIVCMDKDTKVLSDFD